ncbi:CopY/TcrY family copper transport repressor [Granulicatella sp. zg-ZJ]|uniref:CopY/TcrY family copper transport repressor n=1 Tax=unclassified Granulicatella TaxID=2630493 RepID=UPI0013BF532E|nr:MULTISPECIES: CopY/TcrY family copper transport repressor [unclassified Granulicatella]MBS4749805.1 CopY/TcrY family copper transport repressor [Carnobacteriaceae bacterium zg-ZUI78]NEW61922.1 CopY/TcrY family copper transport repressor [Granulicatella sp. zg-ZJ]NEW66893.1 CopY/TcrY family copper transport repressor [Granulicatella sp. zg-84]QMI85904.1 CopY/TcrY family copper transport repressor [Carnobacteriaceae bacterium zg-84]
MSEAEWEIMRVIWANEHVTAQVVFDILAKNKDWQLSTIKTLLGRLVKKGYVSVQKQGKCFLYEASVLEQEIALEKMNAVLEHVCPTKQGQLILDMMKTVPLTQNIIEEIIHLLQYKKDTAPETIMCTCLKGQCHCCKSH